VGSAYIGSFFRYYLGGEQGFASLWHGDSGAPASVAPAKVLVTYEAPSTQKRRLDINRFTGSFFDYLGGAVKMTGLTSDAFPCGGSDSSIFASCLQVQQDNSLREPERGWGFLGVYALPVSWTKRGVSISNGIPVAYGDMRRFRTVELRAGLDFSSKLNAVGKPQDVRIILTDAHGKSVSVLARSFSHALDYPLTAPEDVVPHLLFNPIRVPLSAFHGIDLSRIRSVGLGFDTALQGRIVLTDLAVSD